MILRKATQEAMSDKSSGDLAMGTRDQLEFGQLFTDFFFGGADLVTSDIVRSFPGKRGYENPPRIRNSSRMPVVDAYVAPEFTTIRSTRFKPPPNLYSHNSAKNTTTIRPPTR